MSERIRILSADTGDCTGLGLWTPEDGIWSIALPQHDAEVWLHDQIASAASRPTEIVLEKLVISAATVRKGRQVHRAIEMAGVVKYLARIYGVPLVEQAPSDVMRFASDTVLKRIDWYVKGPDHQRDARRHILTRLAERRLIDLRVLLPEEEA